MIAEGAGTNGIRVNDLRVRYDIRGGALRRIVRRVHAVNGVSFTIPAGTTLALVGESGCGKTTTGRALLGLAPILSGTVSCFGHELVALLRAPPSLPRLGQMVYQDPYASLNPRMTVGTALREVLLVHGLAPRGEAAARVAQLLADVGLGAEASRAYPSELSGGQRQRVVIARAIAMQPRFMVLDEVVSALDVSIQGQIVNLLQDLQQARALTYLFISHNLGVVRQVANEVAVMYAGRIVESAPTQRIFEAPQHPYTATLLAAMLEPDAHTARQRIRQDIPPGSRAPAPPPGCRYRDACAFASAVCAEREPMLREMELGQRVACHHAERVDLQFAMAQSVLPADTAMTLNP